MFRFFFALFLVFILRSFASQNKSTNNQTQCRKDFFKDCNCRDGRDGRDGQNGKDGRDGRDAICGVKAGKGDRGSQGGIAGKNGEKGDKGERGSQGIAGKNGEKGQKGERGSPGKKPDGAIQFSDTADKCNLRIAGTVRYSASQKSLLLCDGSAWLPLLAAGKGYVASKPGRHCLDILNSGQSRGNGLYWIDPNGGSTDDSFQAFCDMETERGGWTLVATKVSPSFSFIKSAFSTVAAKTKHSDAASRIHPSMGDWEEVMFRFADVSTIRVIYNRKAGAPNTYKKEFDKFLMGRSREQRNKNVFGFYKYSPAGHKRSPTRGFVTMNGLHFKSNYGISQGHELSDKWLDMWNGVDRMGNNYIYSDNSRALGTKCIAGYCYVNKPIWVMVR